MRAGIASGQGNRFPKIQARYAHYILKRVIHAQCRSGQPRSARQAHAAIGVQLDIHFAELITGRERSRRASLRR